MSGVTSTLWASNMYAPLDCSICKICREQDLPALWACRTWSSPYRSKMCGLGHILFGLAISFLRLLHEPKNIKLGTIEEWFASWNLPTPWLEVSSKAQQLTHSPQIPVASFPSASHPWRCLQILVKTRLSMSGSSGTPPLGGSDLELYAYKCHSIGKYRNICNTSKQSYYRSCLSWSSCFYLVLSLHDVHVHVI